MLHRSFKPAKCKTSCKLATSRLKLMKNKKGVQLNQMKKELAQLLQSGQDQTARIRVEHVVREEKTIAAYDLIEIYCELIVARMPIIESQKNCPIDLKEAVASVIFASPRCADIPELLDIRKHLTAKYGKEFTSAAVELRPDSGVSRMLVEKLSVVAPDGPTKIKILKAIAEEHNIQWEPKAFGEKDAKPPDDLLNGPTTFEKASTMHVEPPKFQAPPSQDQQHEEPLKNYEQNIRSSMNSQNFASTDTGGIQASSATSHPDVRPDVRNSGMGSERMEVRQSFHGDSDAFSAGRQNWNMGFKDAMSAAQAAAESAELASMAARAAAELSRQYSSESQKTSIHDLRDERHQTYPSSNMTGEHHAKSTTNHPNVTWQHSTVSQKSNIHGLSDESLEKRDTSNLSVAKNQAKDTENHSFHDRNPNVTGQYSAESRKSNIDALRDERSPKSQNERIEKKETPSYSDGHRSAKRSSRSLSSRSSKASIDDDTLMNSISKGEEYSRKSSFEEEATKGEKGTIYSETIMKKQSRESEEVEPLSGRQDSFESRNLNPFGGERIEKQFSSSSSRSRSRTFGDDYAVSDSKNDATEDAFVVIDQGSIRRDMLKSKSYDDDELVAFDEYSSDESGMIDIGPAYDEVEAVEPKSYFPSLDRKPSLEKSIDKGPTFDEVEPKSFFPSPNRKPSPEKSTLDDFGAITSDYSDVPNFDSEDEFEKSRRNGRKGSIILAEERNSGSERKSRLELNDINGESSVFNPINSFLHEVEENVESSDTLKDNEFHHSSSGSESGKELKFGMLTGGLRNKGYNKRPPYTTPSTDTSSSFKKSAEGPAPIDRTALTGVRSSFNSRVSRNADEKLRSTVSTIVSDSDSDSDSDGSRVNKEVNARPSLKSRITSFDRDSADSSEDLRKQNQANRVRLGSGLSRRTKATPSSSSSRVRLGSDAVGAEAQPEPWSQASSSGQWGGREEPSSEKQVNSKPLRDSISAPREGSFNTPEPRSQPSLEKRADPNPTTKPKTQPLEGSFKASEPRSQPHKLSQWGNRDQPGSEKLAVSKPVTVPKIQPHEGSFKAPEPRTHAQSLGQWGNRDRPRSEKQAAPKPISEPKTESHFEPPLRAQLAANRTAKQAASKPTRASIPSQEGRSDASASTVASNVDESVKKSSSLSREDSTGDNSGKNASHVHPKLPDYDNVFAHFQALRANRQ